MKFKPNQTLKEVFQNKEIKLASEARKRRVRAMKATSRDMTTKPSPIYMTHTINPDNRSAVAIVKCINRWARKTRPFEGGRQFGVDFATWNVCYPQIAAAYQKAASVVAGRNGRFLPRF